MKTSRLLAGVVATLALQTAMAADPPKIEYPSTRKVDQVDDYHGTKVPDPYRWLETDVRTSKEVGDWVNAQNRVTFGYLNTIPERDAIREKLTTVWNYERYSIPFKRGGRYFFTKNDGLQNQSVLYTMGALGETPRVLIDPNTWSKDGTVALSGMSASDDGKFLAYGVAEAGSDWQVWHVVDVASGQPLADELKWIKSSNAAWTKDGKGFFYSRFPQPEAGKAYQSLNTNHKLYYHRLGTPQAADVVVHFRPDQPEWNYRGSVTEDGKYLVITTTKGTGQRHQVLVKDLDDPYAMPVPLIDRFENEYSLVGNDGPVLYFKTDLQAPRRRLIAADLGHPAPESWKEIIPESDALMSGVEYVGGRFVAEYLRDARSEVRVFDKEGTAFRRVEFDGIGTASGFAGRAGDPETFFSFSSYTTPPSVYRYDVASGERELLFRSQVAMNPADYEVKQVFYTSKDGTRVPMFISSRRGLKLTGDNPTLLFGYGGFNIPMTPAFSAARLVWMQMGGVLAVANLRGGSEYGEAWHEAGTRLKKQNVFDDFVAAAQYLIDRKYTRPARLAVQGGSNGGLLVGATITQHPELFGAALPAVGVMDMLRFQKFTAGRYWVDDYGSSDNADEFQALYAYSPYHNIKKGTSYPATLITTADTDDRVVPGHSFKFAAAIQEAQAGPAPVLIRIETRAGHGGGKPTTKLIEETADAWAFLLKSLGMKLPAAFSK